MFTDLQKQLLNNYQQNFPISATPYLDIANELRISEEAVLSAFQQLSDEKWINRIGSIIAPNQIGNSSLIAMQIPSVQLQQVAEIINQYPEVNHNYERDNTINLWFVLIARDKLHLQAVIADIEIKTGFKTIYLPLLADYFINLGFELDFND